MLGPTLPLSSDNSFPILKHFNAPNPTKVPEISPTLRNVPTSLPSDSIVKEISTRGEQTSDLLKAKINREKHHISFEPIPLKRFVTIMESISRIVWTEEEVDRMNTIENLQYAVVEKFSYGWPEIEELRI